MSETFGKVHPAGDKQDRPAQKATGRVAVL